MDLNEGTTSNHFSRLFGSKQASSRKKKLIDRLPSLTEVDLIGLDLKDSSCPICLVSFATILGAEEIALTTGTPVLWMLGVTQLDCGHVFCRKDITTWIVQSNTCPTCRQPCTSSSASGTSTPTVSSMPSWVEENDFELQSVSDVLEHPYLTTYRASTHYEDTSESEFRIPEAVMFPSVDADEQRRIVRRWMSLTPPRPPLPFRRRLLNRIRKITKRISLLMYTPL